jgi:osomolarity two-component system, phosphorelay intermediate protein YPD1
MENFRQILDLDEEGEYDFSQETVWQYFSQAATTFKEMDKALCVSFPLYLSRTLLQRSPAAALGGSREIESIGRLIATCP